MNDPQIFEPIIGKIYSKNVLVGNWVADRSRHITKKPDTTGYETTYGYDFPEKTPCEDPARLLNPEDPDLNRYETSYNYDFPQKLYSKNDPAVLWNAKVLAKNARSHPEVGSLHSNLNLYENFSTTYDLSYNHFPKWSKSEVPRYNLLSHEPTEELLTCYGNITSHGLQEDKAYEWKCDTLDPKLVDRSEYSREFLEYDDDSYMDGVDHLHS